MLVNAVSIATREKILDAQLRMVLDEAWDDFKTLTQDSTAVEGNVMWPTDSRLMVDLVNRLYQRGGRLNTIGLPNFSGRRTIAKVLGAMALLDREISLGSDRKKGARIRAERLVGEVAEPIALGPSPGSISTGAWSVPLELDESPGQVEREPAHPDDVETNQTVDSGLGPQSMASDFRSGQGVPHQFDQRSPDPVSLIRAGRTPQARGPLRPFRSKA